MKKVLLIVILAVCAVCVKAQTPERSQHSDSETIVFHKEREQVPMTIKKNAIGIYTWYGTPAGVDYQRVLSKHRRLHFDIFVTGPLFVEGLYQFSTSMEKHFCANAGVGIAAGIGFDDDSPSLGPVGRVGLEYRFTAPWIISFDLGAGIALSGGLFGRFGLGVKYTF